MQTVEQNEITRQGRKPIYPVDEWVAMTLGKDVALEAVKGEDFTCNPSSFRAVMHRSAADRGLKLKSSIEGDTVRFTFYKED